AIAHAAVDTAREVDGSTGRAFSGLHTTIVEQAHRASAIHHLGCRTLRARLPCGGRASGDHMLPVDGGSARDLRAAVLAAGPARQLTGLTPPPTGPTPARRLRAGDFSLLSGRVGEGSACRPAPVFARCFRVPLSD